jgi:hypothetical protein
MTRRITSLISMAAALPIAALSGCAYLHKATPEPVPIIAQAPSVLTPPVAPLTLIASENDLQLPDLPAPPPPNAQPTPPPVSAIVDTTRKPARPAARRRGHKGEIEVAEHETRDRENHEKETPSSENGQPTPENQNVKVTAPTPSGDTTQPTAIGQITAGPTQDTSESRQEAAKLITSTERGVNSLKNLNGDQNKTVARIRSFLDQAQRALHAGDIDGANTLATKAKTLLDELTGAT